MTEVLTARQMRRTRGYKDRPPLDRTAERYFVYRLHDERGDAVYVGRSCDVVARIKAHQGRDWFPAVRSVSMFGPMTWGEAVKAERREIERLQPTGNRDFTKAHGWVPKYGEAS